jgi:ketosteroid isomerase-like protein
MPRGLRKRVYEVYEAFSAGEIDRLAGMLDDHIDFVSNAPTDVFPYLGRRIGKAEVTAALRTVHDEFSSLTFAPIWIVTDDETAGVLLSVSATRRANSRAARFFAAHFLRFRDGRIVEYRSILDSLEAVQQVLGRDFDLTAPHKT